MDAKALEFIRSFLEKEHIARVASATERDMTRFKAKVQEVKVMFTNDLDSGIVRADDVDDEYFADRGQQIKANAPRKLFLIREYQHPNYGLLYRNYVSTERIKGKSYFANYYIADTDDGLRVIARYLVNSAHTDWEWNGGVRMKNLGSFVSVERFQPPTNAQDLEDYESDEGTF